MNSMMTPTSAVCLTTVFLLAGCSSGTEPEETDPTAVSDPTTSPPPSQSAPPPENNTRDAAPAATVPVESPDPPPPPDPPESNTAAAPLETDTSDALVGDVVVMETSLGNMTIKLFPDEAPISVENFLRYANDGFFEDTVFHRVIETFMIQGGGLTADLSPKRGRDPIKNEATNGLSNEHYTVAMARTNVVDSATSQFFINTSNNARSLDHQGSDNYGYAVFGRVTEGTDVVDKIATVPTQRQGPHQDVPVEPVVITSVTIKN